jgi:hypothetical protein
MTCFSTTLFSFKGTASMKCFSKHFSYAKVPQICQILYDPLPFKNPDLSISAASMTCFSRTLFLFKGAANVSNFCMIWYTSRNLLICQCLKYDMFILHHFSYSSCHKCAKFNSYDPVHLRILYLSISAASMTCFSITFFSFKGGANVPNLYDPLLFKKSLLNFQCHEYDMFFYNTFLIQRCRKYDMFSATLLLFKDAVVSEV